MSKTTTKATPKKKSGWKGGSFRASVGGYLKRKHVGMCLQKYLADGFRQVLGVKGKRGKR